MQQGVSPELVESLRVLLLNHACRLFDTGGESMGRSMRAGLVEAVRHSYALPEQPYSWQVLDDAMQEDPKYMLTLARHILDAAAFRKIPEEDDIINHQLYLDVQAAAKSAQAKLGEWLKKYA